VAPPFYLSCANLIEGAKEQGSLQAGARVPNLKMTEEGAPTKAQKARPGARFPGRAETPLLLTSRSVHEDVIPPNLTQSLMARSPQELVDQRAHLLSRNPRETLHSWGQVWPPQNKSLLSRFRRTARSRSLEDHPRSGRARAGGAARCCVGRTQLAGRPMIPLSWLVPQICSTAPLP